MARGDRLVFDLDAEDVKLFCDETDEQLEILDSALVRLEQDADPALLQRIFRAAHTLKGSSATIGHTRMASLTHGMETVLDAVRQGTIAPNGELVDALLQGLDLLRELAIEVQTQTDSGTETGAVELLLRSFTGAPVHLPGAVETAPGLDAEVKEFGDVTETLSMVITIAEDCPLPSIRCYQVLQELDAHGVIQSISPPRDVIDSGGGDNQVVATMQVRSTLEELRTALASISDVESVQFVSAAPGHPGSHTFEPEDETTADEDNPPEPLNVRSLPVAGDGHPQARPASTVRIDVERLDGLMNLVGELVIDHTRLQRIRVQLGAFIKAAGKDAGLAQLSENFEETTAHLGRVTDELQEQIMRTRMLPIRSVLTRLPRLVRDVANKCGKQVDLVVSGEETELDRSVIEEISDPLVHILRNAIDHGIESPQERLAAGKPETGVISITAWNQETYIYLSVKDDGRGIDTGILRRKAVERGLVTAEAAQAASDEAVLDYIFFAGLSTARRISDVSGRGVGMDIVRTNVERLHGQVQVRSTPGAGSEFIIQLPLTLATTKALMVSVNEVTYAVPIVSVTEALSRETADIANVGGQPTLRLRNQLLPVVDLGRALGDGAGHARPCSGRFVVAARHGDRQVGFLVDDLLGEQDVVVKSLGTLLGNRRGLTGATILGDGTLGLIIDTASLIADHTAPNAHRHAP